MTTRAKPAPCEPYIYLYRVSNTGSGYSIGWKCACGARSDRQNHPTREAAFEDWTTHANAEAR